MSFYSLVVRDQKRGWDVIVDTSDKNKAIDMRARVVADPAYRCQILKTDGNSRNIQAGVEYIKNVSGRGLSTIFGFTRIA